MGILETLGLRKKSENNPENPEANVDVVTPEDETEEKKPGDSSGLEETEIGK